MLKMTILILLLAIFTLITFMFLAKSIWEKLMGLNLIVIKIILMITVYAVYIDSELVLDIMVTYSIIGFLSVTLLSRFLLKGGRLK